MPTATLNAALTAQNDDEALECRLVSYEYSGTTKKGNPSEKFWRGIAVPAQGNDPAYYIAWYGKLGSNGQTNVKTAPSRGAAINAMMDVAHAKERKGYHRTWSGVLPLHKLVAHFSGTGRNGFAAADLAAAFEESAAR